MAKVLVMENESIDDALKRFKMHVVKERILSDVKKHRFYTPKGERRRIKSKTARKKAAKRIRIAKRFDPDRDLKPISNIHDVSWPINLNASNEEKPSYYVACLLRYGDMLVLVKTSPKKDSLYKETRLGFPGGSVEPGENIYTAVMREVWEETGLIINPPSEADIISRSEQTGHSKFFFVAEVVGGTPSCGEEISSIELNTFEEVDEMARNDLLRPAHRNAFYAYCIPETSNHGDGGCDVI